MTIKTRTQTFEGGREFSAGSVKAYATELENGGSVEPDSVLSEEIEFTKNGRSHSNVCRHSVDGIGDTYMGLLAESNDVVFHWDDPPTVTTIKGGMNRWKSGVNVTIDATNQGEVEAQDALTAILAGGVRPSMNLPLMLLELRDVPATVRQFIAGAKKLRRIFDAVDLMSHSSDFWRSPVALKWHDKQLRRKALRDLPKVLSTATVKDVANAKLWAQFGMQPLFTDLPKMYRDMSRMWLEWSHLTTQIPKNLRLRASFGADRDAVLSGQCTGSSKEYTGIAKPTSGSGVRISPYLAIGTTQHPFVRVKFTNYWGEYYGEMSEAYLDTDLDRHKLALRMGASGSAAMWELSAFTFVWDMFVDIGRLIAQARARAVAVDQQLHFREGVWLGVHRSTETWLQQWVPSPVVYSVHSPEGQGHWYDYRYSVTRGPWILESRSFEYERDKVLGFTLKPVVRCRVPDLTRLGTLAALVCQIFLPNKGPKSKTTKKPTPGG